MSNTQKAKGVPGKRVPMTVAEGGTPIDVEKIRGLSIWGRGRTPDAKIRESRDPVDGHRIKETVDEHGNSTIEHDTSDDRVDAIVRPRAVKSKLITRAIT